MSRFAALQDAFQRAILDGDEAVIETLTEGARETRATLFGIYRHAYGARLTEAMRKEHEVLHGFLGNETFDEMAAAYIARYPSRHPSVRWVSRNLPAFLREAEPYHDYPIVGDLAALEKALNDAFDSPDGPVLAADDIRLIPPEAWQDLVVSPHPTACRLSLTTNAGVIWSAIRSGEEAEEPVAIPAEILVWRQDTTPMWRELSAEETMAWDETADGVPFGQICVMLATMDDAETAPARAAGYLGGWIATGLLSGATVVTKA